MHKIRVEGNPLGDSYPRLHKPYSNHYSKEEHESVAVAGMLVDVNLDSSVEDVIERDSPDREVVLKEGERLYVEVRVIESGTIRTKRFLEDANHALFGVAARDWHLGSQLSKLNVNISVTGIAGMHELVKETTNYIKGLFGDHGRNERIPQIYTILFGLGARAFWSPKRYEQSAILQESSAWVVKDYISTEIRDAIREKIAKAQEYDPTCRPLWLLLDVVDIRTLPSLVERAAQTAFARTAKH